MTLLFDGIASGLLLFLISVGLSVTLGLMNFVNLAHGAFAMLGGYVCTLLLGRFGVPFLLTLPIVVVVSALTGALIDPDDHDKLIAIARTEPESDEPERSPE